MPAGSQAVGADRHTASRARRMCGVSLCTRGALDTWSRGRSTAALCATTGDRALTVPAWMLLGFAAWTVLLLVATVGIYRWSRILSGTARIASFRADQIEGAGWYQRGTRAHANCIENLPVFAAIVLALQAGNVVGTLVDRLSIAILAARIVQSLVHICFAQTDAMVSVRFAFFSVQIASFIWLIALIVMKLSGSA